MHFDPIGWRERELTSLSRLHFLSMKGLEIIISDLHFKVDFQLCVEPQPNFSKELSGTAAVTAPAATVTARGA